MGEWFTVRRLPAGVTRIEEPGQNQPAYAYLVEGSRDVAVIDTGMGVGDFPGLVAALSDRDPIVLQTHSHWDHAGSAHRFERVFVHEEDAGPLANGWDNAQLQPDFERFLSDRELPKVFDPATFAIPGARITGYLNEGDVIDLGDRQLDVFHLPGHTGGSVGFLDLENRLLFTGDSLHAGNIAVLEARRYRRSIDNLFRLRTLVDAVYPSHGQSPLAPEMIQTIRSGFMEAMTGRRPDGFLAGMPYYQFDGYGYMLPPRRLREEF